MFNALWALKLHFRCQINLPYFVKFRFRSKIGGFSWSHNDREQIKCPVIILLRVYFHYGADCKWTYWEVQNQHAACWSACRASAGLCLFAPEWKHSQFHAHAGSAGLSCVTAVDSWQGKQTEGKMLTRSCVFGTSRWSCFSRKWNYSNSSLSNLI